MHMSFLSSTTRCLGRLACFSCAWLALAMLASPSARAETKIRLATLAPKDTSYHKSLQAMGEKWRQASGGNVTLTIYTDGTMGGESDMVRRMRVGQIQAAMLTVNGLMQIDSSVSCIQNLPMMFHNMDEADYVRGKLQVGIEKKFLDKGFVVLFWGDAGWISFFTRKEAIRPDDFKNLKMFVGSGDTPTADIIKGLGITPVPLEQTDILTGLQTGLIDTVPTVPFYALAGQFYLPASHMVEVKWAPLIGGTVITKKAWDSIPANQREEFKKAAAEAGAQIKSSSRTEEAESIEAMKKRGLTVHPLTPEVEVEWQNLAEKVYPMIRGKIVAADLFDEVQNLLKDYRAAHPVAKK
jgi:TRAP-type C4-dicarboxylate transport system substrate-binding protein